MPVFKNFTLLHDDDVFSRLLCIFLVAFFLIWLDSRVLTLDTIFPTDLIKYTEISKNHLKLKLVQPSRAGWENELNFQ